jgi:membrane protein DedA with SNARE-associated domain
MDWKKYALATLVGSIPRTFVLGLAGWYIGTEYTAVANSLRSIENSVLYIILVVIVVGLLILYIKRHDVRKISKRFTGRIKK